MAFDIDVKSKSQSQSQKSTLIPYLLAYSAGIIHNSNPQNWGAPISLSENNVLKYNH